MANQIDLGDGGASAAHRQRGPGSLWITLSASQIHILPRAGRGLVIPSADGVRLVTRAPEGGNSHLDSRLLTKSSLIQKRNLLLFMLPELKAPHSHLHGPGTTNSLVIVRTCCSTNKKNNLHQLFATKRLDDLPLLITANPGGRHARSLADQLCLVGDDCLPSYQSVAIHFLGRS